MSDARTALEASLEETPAEFLERMQAAIDARPLTLEPGADAGITLPWADATRLLAIAQLGSSLGRAVAASYVEGPLLTAPAHAKGRVVAVIDGDDRNRLIAAIEFDDEDDLRIAAAMIASRVEIAPAPDFPPPANEIGQGSPSTPSQEDEP